MYITVVDKIGGWYSNTGPHVPISHRFFVSNKELYGAESLTKLFNSVAEMHKAIEQMVATPRGETERYTWEHK